MEKIVKIIIGLSVLCYFLFKIIFTLDIYVDTDILDTTLNKKHKEGEGIMLRSDYENYFYGAQNFHESNFQDSINHFEKLMNKDNIFLELIDNQKYHDNQYINMALLFSYMDLGKYSEASVYHEKLLQLFEKDMNISMYTIYSKIYGRMPKEQVMGYMGFIENNKVYDFHVLLGDTYLLSGLGNSTKAIDKYKGAFYAKNDRAIKKQYINNQLGLAYDYQQNYLNSINYYNHALVEHDYNILSLKNLCISTYLNAKDLSVKETKTLDETFKVTTDNNKALTYCETFFDKYEKDHYILGDSEIFKYVGHIYTIGLKDDVRGEEYYLKAVEFDNMDYKSYNNLLSINERKFEKTRNKKYLDRQLEYAEKTYKIHSNLVSSAGFNSDVLFLNNLLITYDAKINYEFDKGNYSIVEKYGDKAVELDSVYSGMDGINFGMDYIVGSKYLDVYEINGDESIFIKAEKYLNRSIYNMISVTLHKSASGKLWAKYKLGLLYYYSGMNKQDGEKLQALQFSIMTLESTLRQNSITRTAETRKLDVYIYSTLQKVYMDLFLETSNRNDGEKSIFYGRNIFGILKKLDPVYKESLNNVEKMEKLLQ